VLKVGVGRPVLVGGRRWMIASLERFMVVGCLCFAGVVEKRWNGFLDEFG
jgi:hypothetical protein